MPCRFDNGHDSGDILAVWRISAGCLHSFDRRTQAIDLVNSRSIRVNARAAIKLVFSHPRQLF
jgi:hypothetical protein